MPNSAEYGARLNFKTGFLSAFKERESEFVIEEKNLETVFIQKPSAVEVHEFTGELYKDSDGLNDRQCQNEINKIRVRL